MNLRPKTLLSTRRSWTRKLACWSSSISCPLDHPLLRWHIPHQATSANNQMSTESRTKCTLSRMICIRSRCSLKVSRISSAWPRRTCSTTIPEQRLKTKLISWFLTEQPAGLRTQTKRSRVTTIKPSKIIKGWLQRRTWSLRASKSSTKTNSTWTPMVPLIAASSMAHKFHLRIDTLEWRKALTFRILYMLSAEVDGCRRSLFINRTIITTAAWVQLRARCTMIAS